MDNALIWDADDFGANRVISDMCQSHDCRDKLDEFHYVNPNFKATLFAIPSQMTYELCEWCYANRSWIELAMHGISHSSNYECEKMTYEAFDNALKPFLPMLEAYFVKGFKAPGWQISDDIYKWLNNHGYWVADQSYNNVRRMHLVRSMPAYVNNGGSFISWDGEQDLEVQGKHHHTWDCMGNGVYEASDQIKQYIAEVNKFKFISEVLAA